MSDGLIEDAEDESKGLFTLLEACRHYGGGRVELSALASTAEAQMFALAVAYLQEMKDVCVNVAVIPSGKHMIEIGSHTDGEE